MAGIKISALPISGVAAITDVVPVVQSGVTYKQAWSTVINLFNNQLFLSSVAQVSGLPSALAALLPLSGGTMTGNLILNGNPTVPFQAATKSYVDTVATGFTVILASDAATTANLNVTPAGAGIGATLTDASGTFAPFSTDGVSPTLNSRILVKNQTLSQHNGVYVLTTNGDSISVPYVLTRATDYDTPVQIQPGTLIAVNTGTINANTSWLETATVVTVDTDPILFSQFTFAPSAFLTVANNLSDVANAATSRTNLGLTAAATMTLPVSGTNGGTGVNNGASTITIGGNVIFNGVFTFAGTLTANTSVTFPISGTLLTSAQPTINQPNIVGVTNGSNASAGSVGEYVSSVILSGSAISLVSITAKTITSIVLTAGDWDVQGEFSLTGTSLNVSYVQAQISPTTNTFVTIPSDSVSNNTMPAQNSGLWSIGGSGIPYMPLAPCRISINVNTTFYLVGFAKFASGTALGYGKLTARRIR